jgi:hypothetical protein
MPPTFFAFVVWDRGSCLCMDLDPHMDTSCVAGMTGAPTARSYWLGWTFCFHWPWMLFSPVSASPGAMITGVPS